MSGDGGAMVMRLSDGSTGEYVPALRPVGRLAILVAVLSAVVAASMQVFTVSMLHFLTLAAEPVEGTCVVAPPPLAETMVTTMGVAFLTCVFAGPGAVFAALVWVWRARTNAEILSAAPQRLSRCWSVGCWFVPIANLVLPPRVLADIWAASCTAEHLPWIRLVRAWWVALWTSVVIGVLIVLVAEDVAGLVVAVLLGLFTVAGHAAAGLFAATVLKISAGQTGRAG
jgi:uncharacterized protein DUF4328